MSGYRSPALDQWQKSRNDAELEAEARRRPRVDWTDLTYEEYRALSGAERNQLFRSDPDRYKAMSDGGDQSRAGGAT